MSGLPILLKPNKILLIGGGNIAYQKAQVLDDNKINFTTISKEFLNGFKKLNTKRIKRKFKKNDLESYQYVIDATGNDKVTRKVLKERKKKFFLLNVVDQPAYCDFYFNSLINYGDLKISISSSGASPKASQIIRDKIKSIIPKNIEDIIIEAKEKRKNGSLNIREIEQKTKKILGKVSLVGAGLGSVELLTIKAYKTIQEADVILYDNLISNEILTSIPQKTERIFVGKKMGNHTMSQDAINKLIIKHAKNAKHVVRLKSGDPFIFGRGWEEADFVEKHGINLEVINGLSSAIAGPSFGGIALTKRETTCSFSVVSAHLKNDIIYTDWLDLLHRKNHSVVVLMGISFVQQIVDEAKKRFISKNYPVAIISNASRENQKVRYTLLKNLIKDAKNIERPAILVFGENVKYPLKTIN